MSRYDDMPDAARQLMYDFDEIDIAEMLAAANEANAVLRDLVSSMADPDPCDLDHHGYCQPHGWTYTEPACPMARAAELGLIVDDEEDDRG